MIKEQLATCPYCGEPIQLLVDTSGEDQHYFEDCQVCCRPILINLRINDDAETFTIELQRDDE